eukprot:TRINITY_DN336_c5_g1_i1.p1 TRINITY_DN336_c5_g1~~TRINITY_DN336_c5_g1_i1.p1  ORF type:complete len:504 (+),score=212.65 TRINITY_DN336_c5_g1_i1:26-1537(+)
MKKKEQGDTSKHGGVVPSLSGFGRVGFVSTVSSITGQLSKGDLTHITLPSLFCEPVSTLEVIPYKRMRAMDLLQLLPKQEHPLQRILTVTKWYFESMNIDPYGRKPLNPILAETFRCRMKDFVYVAEQVSHHPPITAFHFEHTKQNIQFFGNAEVFANFQGNSVMAGFIGRAIIKVDLNEQTIPKGTKAPSKKKKHKKKKNKAKKSKGESSGNNENNDEEQQKEKNDEEQPKKKKKKKKKNKAKASNKEESNNENSNNNNNNNNNNNEEVVQNIEEYVLDPSLPAGYCRGLLVGKRYNEVGGEVKITCMKTGLTSVINFHLTGYIWGATHSVTGHVEDEFGKKMVEFKGRWNETIKISKFNQKQYKELLINHLGEDLIFFDQEEYDILDYDDLEVIGSTKENLCSRQIWGETKEAIRTGDSNISDPAKSAVEEEQRRIRKLREKGEMEYPVFQFFNINEDDEIPYSLKRDNKDLLIFDLDTPYKPNNTGWSKINDDFEEEDEN